MLSLHCSVVCGTIVHFYIPVAWLIEAEIWDKWPCHAWSVVAQCADEMLLTERYGIRLFSEAKILKVI